MIGISLDLRRRRSQVQKPGATRQRPHGCPNARRVLPRRVERLCTGGCRAGGELEQRVTSGYAADVAEHFEPGSSSNGTWKRVAAPYDRSSRFLSLVDWLDAQDTAYLTLEKQFKAQGVTMTHGPIPGKGGAVYPKASGYMEFLDIDDPSKTIARPLGEGYAGVKDGSERIETFARTDGTTIKKEVYPTTMRVPPEKITLDRQRVDPHPPLSIGAAKDDYARGAGQGFVIYGCDHIGR